MLYSQQFFYPAHARSATLKIEKLRELIAADDELRPHREYIETLVKPSVVLEFADDAPSDLENRFGGNPAVPPGFAWPSHEVGEYRFLGQINFGEIDSGPFLLPTKGILSLFYAYDKDGEVFWRDDGYILGHYWPDLGELKMMHPPSPYLPAKAPRKLRMTAGVDIPSDRELRNDWPFDTDLLYWLAEEGCFADDYLLGYPSFYTLAYDPTPGPEWISLLTLKSHDELEWCWHDGDKLMVFIETEKLKAKDFSSLKSDAG